MRRIAAAGREIEGIARRLETLSRTRGRCR
jgi:hypothetical protein